MSTSTQNHPILQLRVALTTRDYERLVKFYCDGLGMEPAAVWNNDGGRALMEAGSHEAHLIQQPLAAALGIDLPIGSPSGNMVICLGGGCTEAAVLAMYGIVSADTLRAGGL